MKNVANLNKKAFTLVEMLVVVLIIGILAAIAVPKYQLAVEKSIMQEAIINLKAIAQANDVFYLQNGRYANANEMDKLDISIPGTITTDDNRILTKNFIYSPNGWLSANNPDVFKAIAQRDPLYTYYIGINQSDNKLFCGQYATNINSTQQKLCDQINRDGHL